MIEKRKSVPVYKVRPIDGGSVRTLHRNLLMKVDHLPLNAFGQAPSGPLSSPVVEKEPIGDGPQVHND